MRNLWLTEAEKLAEAHTSGKCQSQGSAGMSSASVQKSHHDSSIPTSVQSHIMTLPGAVSHEVSLAVIFRPVQGPVPESLAFKSPVAEVGWMQEEGPIPPEPLRHSVLAPDLAGVQD